MSAVTADPNMEYRVSTPGILGVRVPLFKGYDLVKAQAELKFQEGLAPGTGIVLEQRALGPWVDITHTVSTE